MKKIDFVRSWSSSLFFKSNHRYVYAPDYQRENISLNMFLPYNMSTTYLYLFPSSKMNTKLQYHKLCKRFYYSYNRQSGSSAINPYEVLGITKSATDKEIKIAYFKKAKQFHPDMNPNDKNANANFQKVIT